MLSNEAEALLDAIAKSESKGKWNVIYGGSHFSDYSQHPRQYVTIKSGPNKGKKSSAAGKYQITATTYDRVAPKLGITDFSPQSQKEIAWYLANEAYGPGLQEALALGDPGTLAQVGEKLSGVWTSLPSGIEQTQTGNRFVSNYDTALSHPVPPADIPVTPAPREEGTAARISAQYGPLPLPTPLGAGSVADATMSPALASARARLTAARAANAGTVTGAAGAVQPSTDRTLARVENLQPGFVLNEADATRMVSDLQRDFGLTPEQASGIAGTVAAMSAGGTDRSGLAALGLPQDATYEQVYGKLKDQLGMGFLPLIGPLNGIRNATTAAEAAQFLIQKAGLDPTVTPAAQGYAGQILNPTGYANGTNRPLFLPMPEPRPQPPATSTVRGAALGVTPSGAMQGATLGPTMPSMADWSLRDAPPAPVVKPQTVSSITGGAALSPMGAGRTISPSEPSSSVTGTDITRSGAAFLGNLAGNVGGVSLLQSGVDLPWPSSVPTTVTKTIMVPNPNYTNIGSAALGAPDLMSITPYLDANGNVVDPLNAPKAQPPQQQQPKMIPKTITVQQAPPPPPTYTGSATGNKYNIGQNYTAGGFIYRMTDAGPQKIGKLDTTAAGKQIAQENRESAGNTYNVFGENNAYQPKLVQESTRFQTGY